MGSRGRKETKDPKQSDSRSKKRSPKPNKKDVKSVTNENPKRSARKAHYDRMKLPKMSLDVKRALNLEGLEAQANQLKGSRRTMLMARIHFEKKRRKAERRRERKEAEARGETVVRETPKTIESMRIEDETMVRDDDDEFLQGLAVDEFASYFDGSTTPKLLMTTCKQKPCQKLLTLLKEFQCVFPNCFYVKRNDSEVKSMIESAQKAGYTDLLLFTQKHKKPHGLYISHLPNGPTTYWRVSGLTLGQDIKGGATMTTHAPEVLLRNFDTQLGKRISRQLQSLFPIQSEFMGRRVVTFHNQRDFIFFRHYRYVFEEEGKKAELQEIGPRFTLKLRFLQEGTFNTSKGKFEYLWRPDMQVSRKQFYV